MMAPMTDEEGMTLPITMEDVLYISCCLCGQGTPANPTGKCMDCLRGSVDPTAGLPATSSLNRCRQCERWQTPRQDWVTCAWESKELLSLCLTKLRNHIQASPAQVVESELLYTEPHSRRVRCRLVLQQEAAGGVIVEKWTVVEFTVQNLQCDKCKRAFTPHTWTSIVQVRQRAQHKRSLMYLEQLILKAKLHEKMINIVEAPEGLDFQFDKVGSARDFACFIANHFPAQINESSQLVSQDFTNNTCFIKYSFSCEIAPICQDDLVFIPPPLAKKMFGGISSFLLCSRIGTRISLIDPFTLRGLDIPSEKFFRAPFQSILVRRHMEQFIVLNTEVVDMREMRTAAHATRHLDPSNSKRSQRGSKVTSSRYEQSLLNSRIADFAANAGRSVLDAVVEHQAAGAPQGPSHGVMFSDPRRDPLAGRLIDVEAARLADLGQNDTRFIVRSHLGSVIRPGDIVLGYDLRTINLPGLDESSGVQERLPSDILLVRKAKRITGQSYKRNWVLRRLNVERTGSMDNNRRYQEELLDTEHFKEDLEDHEALRANVNIYRAATEDEDLIIKAEEMMAKLDLDDGTRYE